MIDYESRNQLSKKLRKLLRQRNMNQKDLSIASGLGEPMISRYMNGERKPSYDSMVKLARALGCTTDELMIFDE